MGAVDREKADRANGHNPPSSAVFHASSAVERAELPRALCAFWLGGQCYALDVRIVGELVTVDRYVPIPLEHPAVDGLFNLRGTPVALVNLGRLLGLASGADGRISRFVLVLRVEGLTAGVSVDRIEGVFAMSRGRMRPVEGASGEDLVREFFELDGTNGRALTVLSQDVLLARLRGLMREQDSGS